MRIAVAGASGLVGSQATNLAHEAGHDVVRLSRSDGIDLTDPRGLVQALADVEAVIDVTRSPSMDKQTAIDFFTTVSTNLGRASVEAGVHRTVVLSIVGIEDAQDFDWYVATLAHERASRASCPGVCVVRSTQFHEFPGQVLARSRVEDRALVMDVPTQPVDSGEVARALIETATDPGVHGLGVGRPQGRAPRRLGPPPRRTHRGERESRAEDGSAEHGGGLDAAQGSRARSRSRLADLALSTPVGTDSTPTAVTDIRCTRSLPVRDRKSDRAVAGTAQHPLPWLALTGGRAEVDRVLVARPGSAETHPPRSRTAAEGARLALRPPVPKLTECGGFGPPGGSDPPLVSRRHSRRVPAPRGRSRGRARGLRKDGGREPSRGRHEPLSPAAQGQSRRLVGVGRRGVRRGAAPRRTGLPVASGTPPATGAT